MESYNGSGGGGMLHENRGSMSGRGGFHVVGSGGGGGMLFRPKVRSPTHYLHAQPQPLVPIADCLPGEPLEFGAAFGFQPREGCQTRGPAGANLFCFHLPNEMTNWELYLLFRRFGTILSVNIMCNAESGKSRGFGFISFLYPQDAVQALDQMTGFRVGHKKLKIEQKRDQVGRGTEMYSQSDGGDGGNNESPNDERDYDLASIPSEDGSHYSTFPPLYGMPKQITGGGGGWVGYPTPPLLPMHLFSPLISPMTTAPSSPMGSPRRRAAADFGEESPETLSPEEGFSPNSFPTSDSP